MKILIPSAVCRLPSAFCLIFKLGLGLLSSSTKNPQREAEGGHQGASTVSNAVSLSLFPEKLENFL
jgi:hypothetical protein